MIYAFVAVAALIAAAWRFRHVRALERLSMQRRSLAADGIVRGGEAIELTQPGAPAILLFHGGGDTPQSLRYLAEHLHDRGYAVFVPLLPGHGRTIHDFARVSADDMTAAALSHFRALRHRHDWVAVGGMSMGGALAIQVAAETPDLPALALLAPYIAMPPRIERAAQTSWIWGAVVPFVKSADGTSIRDPNEQQRNLAYGVFSSAALRALRRTVKRAADALPRVTAPTLVVQSREDNRISVVAAEAAFARLGATEKRLVWTTGAAHIITVDYGYDRVIAEVGDWMDGHRHLGDSAPRRLGG